MKVELNDKLRILLAGAVIAAVSGFIVATVSQSRSKDQLEFVERIYEKRISTIKGQHTKEVNKLQNTCTDMDRIEKKIDLLNSTKGS